MSKSVKTHWCQFLKGKNIEIYLFSYMIWFKKKTLHQEWLEAFILNQECLEAFILRENFSQNGSIEKTDRQFRSLTHSIYK